MHLLLQQSPQAGKPPRFVQLTLQADLFGGWMLLRESGQHGQAHTTLRREQYLDHASAIAALEKARDAQLKKGFMPMAAPSIAPLQ